MPTAKHRIAAYLPPEIDDKFQVFKQEREVGDSQALILILTEFLGVDRGNSPKLEVMKSELKSELLSELNARFDKLRSELKSELSVTSQSESSVLPEQESVRQPLTTVELAERFGCNDSLIRKQKSKYGGESEKFVAWTRSRDPQGHGWQFDEESKSFALTVLLA